MLDNNDYHCTICYFCQSLKAWEEKKQLYSVNIPINDVPMITTFFPWAKSAGGKY